MRKSKFVYKLEKHTPSTERFGHFYVTVLDLENTTSDQICISWQCNLYDNEQKGWYACRPKWEHDNYNLLTLLPKMKKANINWGSSIKEVIDFLHANHIEHTIRIKLVNDQQQHLFEGLVSVSEIIKGKFTRYWNRKKFTIPADQQAQLIEQIQESKKMILEARRTIAV